MNFILRSISTDEVLAFRTALSMGFGQDPAAAGEARFRELMPLDRTVAAFDGDELVATLGDFEMQLTVPGDNQLTMAGTTMVTVRSTHRRRGIMRAMVKQHLDNAVSRNEPLAGLWASEPDIYGRFGFGLAAESHEIKLDSRRTTVPAADATVTLAMINADRLVDEVLPFWSSVATSRSGFVERNVSRWRDIAQDPEDRREGKSMSRHVVARRANEIVGYVSYRQSGDWDDGVPNGTITVGDLVAADVGAHRSLWSYVTSVDLFPQVHFWNAATDDTVVFEASEPRAVRRLVTDTLYVRILDLVGVLTGRSYEVDGEIVISVEDPLGYAEDKILLRAIDGVGTVARTSMPADVSLDVRELSAMYLGRSCVDGYEAAGRIAGSPESVRLLDQLFRTARAPWCPEMF